MTFDLVWLMVVAGIAGGAINFMKLYLERRAADPEAAAKAEDDRTAIVVEFTRTMLVGLAASFLVPLFLNTISSTLVQSIVGTGATNSDHVYVFFGFCLVAAIASNAFIDTLTKRVMQMAQSAEDKAQKAESHAGELKRQQDQDETTWTVVRRHLDGDPEVNIANMMKSIELASKTERTKIYFAAKVQRADNWQHAKPRMELTIPIFEALIAADDDNAYHQNYAQLGYALKDKLEPYYPRALEMMNKAIKGRGKWTPEFGQHYEMNRAICRIAVNGDDAKEAILKDLKTAAQNEEVFRKIILPNEDENAEPLLVEWLKANEIKPGPEHAEFERQLVKLLQELNRERMRDRFVNPESQGEPGI